MARKYTLLVVVLSVIAVLCLAFTACGGGSESTPATTTTNPAESSSTEATTTPDSSSTEAPGSSTAATESSAADSSSEAPVINAPVSSSLEERLFGPDSDVNFIQPHMAEDDVARIFSRMGTDNVMHEWVIYFPIKSESGVFTNTSEDHPTHPNTPGLFFSTPIELFVRKNDEVDFTRYNITYYETNAWWEIWVEAEGFVPEDGAQYEFMLFIKSGAKGDGAVYPDGELCLWDMGDMWTWTAPEELTSGYFTSAQLETMVGNRTRLLEHAATTIDAENKLNFQFKSDGDPFNNTSDTPGVQFTLMGDLYINGESYGIVAGTYLTEEHYIINFQIENFTFESGQTYEILFTINGNDNTGTYCNDPDGYYALIEYVAP